MDLEERVKQEMERATGGTSIHWAAKTGKFELDDAPMEQQLRDLARGLYGFREAICLLAREIDRIDSGQQAPPPS